MAKVKYKKQLLFLDLETTDLDPKRGRIMEVGAVNTEFAFDSKAKAVRVVFGDSFSTLVNPEVPLSQTAAGITGITLQELSSAPLWPEVCGRISDFLGNQVLAGHNLEFDLGFLRAQGVLADNPHVDTLETALTILPFSESHSLEYLADKFGVLEGNPHRALIDCKNNARVLAEILNEFLRFPLDLQREIKKVMASSDLAFADLFIDLPEVKLLQLQQAQVRRYQETAPFPFSWPPGTLISLPLSFTAKGQWIASLVAEKTKALVAISQTVYLNDAPQSQVMPDPGLVLCEKRFHRFRALAASGVAPAKILTKVLILRYLKSSAALNLLKWTEDERALLPAISLDPQICPMHKCEFFRLLRLPGRKVYFASLTNLFKLAQDWKLNFKQHKLLMMDLASIEQEFTESLVRSYHLQRIKHRLALVYKLEPHTPAVLEEVPVAAKALAEDLGMFFNLLQATYGSGAGRYTESLVVDQSERDSERFQKFFYPAQKLIQTLEIFLGFLRHASSLAREEDALEIRSLEAECVALQKFIETFFVNPTDDDIYCIKFNTRYTEIGTLPRNVGDRWQKFCEKFLSVTIADTELPKIAFSYFQKRLGLAGLKLERVSAAEVIKKVEIKISRREPPSQMQAKHLRELSGNTLIVVQNEVKLAEYYQMLSRELGSEFAILAHRLSGSQGRIKAQFRNHEMQTRILLLTNNVLLHVWHSLPDPLHNLIILKLPFEAPLAKPSLYGLPPTLGFSDHILPRAIQHLHVMLCRFLATPGDPKRVFLWDGRTFSDYGGEFLNYLNEFPDFQISTE